MSRNQETRLHRIESSLDLGRLQKLLRDVAGELAITSPKYKGLNPEILANAFLSMAERPSQGGWRERWPWGREDTNVRRRGA